MNNPGYDSKGMFRNAFGDPKPNTAEQLNEAFDELEIDTTASMSADISEELEDTGGTPHFVGWCAEIHATTFDGEEKEISTGGWKEGKAALIEFLRGIDCDINEV